MVLQTRGLRKDNRPIVKNSFIEIDTSIPQAFELAVCSLLSLDNDVFAIRQIGNAAGKQGCFPDSLPRTAVMSKKRSLAHGASFSLRLHEDHASE